MWYSYTLVDTMAEIVPVIGNLADWTSPSGVCFLPITDAHDRPLHASLSPAG